MEGIALIKKVGGFYQRSELNWMKGKLKVGRREVIIGVKVMADILNA